MLASALISIDIATINPAKTGGEFYVPDGSKQANISIIQKKVAYTPNKNIKYTYKGSDLKNLIKRFLDLKPKNTRK